jgi:hypothetical protein
LIRFTDFISPYLVAGPSVLIDVFGETLSQHVFFQTRKLHKDSLCQKLPRQTETFHLRQSNIVKLRRLRAEHIVVADERKTFF